MTDSLPLHSFSLGGTWDIAQDGATTINNSTLNYHFFASKVFLVLRPNTTQKSAAKIYIDGKFSQEIIINSDKLYTLYDNKSTPQDHELLIEFQTPGTQAFAFTFG